MASDTIAASASGGVLTDVDDTADAVNNAFVVDENSKILGLGLILDNGSGPDVDPTTALLCITAVNGNTASVGNLIAISSGAPVTVMIDGTLNKDTNSAFDYAPSAASGPAIILAKDRFSDSLADGGTATITVFGRDSNDVLT